jgi:hypothetical protein
MQKYGFFREYSFFRNLSAKNNVVRLSPVTSFRPQLNCFLGQWKDLAKGREIPGFANEKRGFSQLRR